MQILTPALVFVAAVAYGVEASVDFTTATAKSPMKTRAVDMETTKFRCKRLAVCAADPVAKLDVRSMGKPGENNKPKSPIIFDRCMTMCSKEWPMPDSRQGCCDYCDEMLSCCPGPEAAGGTPVLCQSARHRLPKGTRLLPEPSLREAVDRERERLRGALGNVTDEERARREAALPRVPSRWEKLVREGPGSRARVWDGLYSRASTDEGRRMLGRPPLSDEEWAALEKTLPDRERFVNGPLLGDDEGAVGRNSTADGRGDS